MTALGLYSFLGQIAHDHYAAVGELVARRAGVEPEPLTEPGLDRLDEVVGDGRPSLLFLCGLPYTRLRDRGFALEPLGAPVPASGDGTATYTADLVVRPGLDVTSPEELAGHLMAFNGDDSLSGWVLPRSGLPASLYARTRCSGSHRRSLELVRDGLVDAAAIDSTVLALEARADPGLGELRVIARVGPAPSPPLVLANGTPQLRDALAAALVGLEPSDEGRAALDLGAITRFVPVTDADYDAVRELDRRRPRVAPAS